MDRETLFLAIGTADASLLEQSERHRRRIAPWLALAACLCLVVGVAVRLISPFPSTSTPSGPSGGSNPYGTVYAGPILPLTADSDALSARRTLNITLSEDDRLYYTAKVTDSYLLSNPTDEEITTIVSYPMILSFNDFPETAPCLTLNDQYLDAELYAGGYAGVFAEGGMNLQRFAQWEDYAALLSDGSYLADAMEDISLDIPVVVYALSDLPDGMTSLRFKLSEGAYQLNSDFSSVAMDTDGYYTLEADTIRNETPTLILIGGDWLDYSLSTQAVLTRSEGTLEEALLPLAEEYTTPTQSELQLICLKKLCAAYGPCSDAPMARYTTSGYVGDLVSDTLRQVRVFYLTAQITIPAHGQVTLAAHHVRPVSYNFASSELGGHYAVDLLTTAGSSLAMDRAELTFTCPDTLTPADGETEFLLEQEQAHYEFIFTP